jgi:Kdo2-lipid IVA lauroyltransferase/acyltransferase
MKKTGRRPLYHFWTPNYWPVWLALGLLRLVCLLPHRARLKVGFALGRIGHRLTPSRRAITRRNIELCFPEMNADERDTLALAHFEALGASLIEMGLGHWASDEELNSLMKIEGIEHLRGPAAEGVGVILLSAHFTTIEVVGRVLKMHGPPYDGVYRKNRDPFYTEFLLRGREQAARHGIEKTDIKSMVRSLRAGVAVWYAADQSYSGKQSALLPFFGVPAMTNTATTTLGKLGKAVAVPFFPSRLKDGSYLLTILPPLEGFPSDDPAADTENFTALLEENIRQYPEQYFWIHKKFKNRPAPLPDVYADLDSLK